MTEAQVSEYAAALARLEWMNDHAWIAITLGVAGVVAMVLLAFDSIGAFRWTTNWRAWGLGFGVAFIRGRAYPSLNAGPFWISFRIGTYPKRGDRT